MKAWDRWRGSKEESGTAATAGAAAAGLTASAHKQQIEETDEQAAELEAHPIKRQLGMQRALVASSVPPAGRPWCLCLCQWLAG